VNTSDKVDYNNNKQRQLLRPTVVEFVVLVADEMLQKTQNSNGAARREKKPGSRPSPL